MSNGVRREGVATARIETAYQLELAVGASHIGSMLYPATRYACIEELAASFVVKHGASDLRRFLMALAKRLDVRANTEGALAVRHYGMHGAAPAVHVAQKAPAAAPKRSKSGAAST
jgi:hypothetical protein